MACLLKALLSLNLTWHVLSGEIAADESLDLQIKHPLSGFCLGGPFRALTLLAYC